MKNKLLLTICLIFSLASPLTALSQNVKKEEQKETESLRSERQLIREGNKLYKDKRYAEAEIKYRKALAENNASEIGLYNLALSLINQANPGDKQTGSSPLAAGDSLLRNFVQVSQNMPLVSKAFYNLGNIAFNQEQYQQAVDAYKDCLRRNPNDDKARENLRLAQKKLQEQQNDKNQDNKDQDKKDQNKDNQEQQNQNNQNQQDQQKPENNDKQNQEQNQQQQQQPQAADNSEQILNAVQNKENTTQQKVGAELLRQKQEDRKNTKYKW